MSNLVAIILAAGRGKRMRSELAKVMHPLFGKPMLAYALEAVESLKPREVVVVAGHQAERVEAYLKERGQGSGARGQGSRVILSPPKAGEESSARSFGRPSGSLRMTSSSVRVVIQKKLLGTADAVSTALSALEKGRASKGSGPLKVLVLAGDVPLITPETLEKLLALQEQEGASCAVLTALRKDPTGYGRIVRNDRGGVARIVEEDEADVFEKAIEEVNSGIYVFDAVDLSLSLKEVSNARPSGEFYLTDVVALLAHRGRRVAAYQAPDSEEVLGINTRRDLAEAFRILNGRGLERLMEAGVTIVDPKTTFVGPNVTIGSDTVIEPMTVVESDVRIGRSCRVGPFARVRSGSVLEDEVVVGNFIEINRSKLGRGTVAKHQAYLGDATVGEGVNVGAGTITANYDGKGKFPTAVGEGAFIGSGTILVAPVKVGKKSVTGAGAVVTKGRDVPPGAVVVGVPAKVLRKGKECGRNARCHSEAPERRRRI